MSDSDTRPIKILLAEDSPTDAELAREAFKNGRLLNELVIVKDGVEALDYLHRRNEFEKVDTPDVVILDLNMPRKDGRAVLEEMKKDTRLKRIPVVVLTTSEDENDVLRSYELQASCYVTKPMDFEKFLEVAKQIKYFFFHIVTLPPNE